MCLVSMCVFIFMFWSTYKYMLFFVRCGHNMLSGDDTTSASAAQKQRIWWVHIYTFGWKRCKMKIQGVGSLGSIKRFVYVCIRRQQRYMLLCHWVWLWFANVTSDENNETTHLVYLSRCTGISKLWFIH